MIQKKLPANLTCEYSDPGNFLVEEIEATLLEAII